MQLARVDSLAHCRGQTREIQFFIRSAEANARIDDLQRISINDALESLAAETITDHGLSLTVAAPTDQFGAGMRERQADPAFKRLLPAGELGFLARAAFFFAG